MIDLVEALQPFRVAFVGFKVVDRGSQLLGKHEQVEPELVADVRPRAARPLCGLTRRALIARSGDHGGGRRRRRSRRGDAIVRLPPRILISTAALTRTVLVGTELVGTALVNAVLVDTELGSPVLGGPMLSGTLLAGAMLSCPMLSGTVLGITARAVWIGAATFSTRPGAAWLAGSVLGGGSSRFAGAVGTGSGARRPPRPRRSRTPPAR
jgi:hypothetical protein